MRHHFVPQFLMKFWSDTTRDGKLEVFRLDLPLLPSSRMTPKYTGFEQNLYSLTKPKVANVERQDLETQFLMKIDDGGSRALQKMAENYFDTFNSRDCQSWARFIFSLLYRTPDVVSLLHSKASKTLVSSLNERPEEYKVIAETIDPPTLNGFVEKNIPGYVENYGILSLRNIIVDNDKIQKLLQMKWYLFDFKMQTNHLLLSDRPCILTASFNDQDLLVVLPLGPKKAFMATRSDQVADFIGRQRPKDLLMYINESSITQSRNRVYACDDTPHHFIRNRHAAWADCSSRASN